MVQPEPVSDPQFEFQKLEVYQLAMELRPLVAEILQQLPRGYGDLRGQMKRSERSIRFNIAEGAGKHRPGGKAERFRTARGSANEVASGLHEIWTFEIVDRDLVSRALSLCHRIISMLTKLVLYWERQT